MDGLTNENKAELIKVMEESKHEAEEMIKDEEKTKKTIETAIEKAQELEKKSIFETIWDDLTAMFGMAKDWIYGKYRETSTTSIIAILSGIIYFLSPIDIIPDIIPIIGYLDDIFVLSIIINQVRKDIDNYKIWKKAQK